MIYVEMTANEAVKLRGGDTKVLVSIATADEQPSEFTSKKFADCENIIRNGDEIQHILDDFVESLRVNAIKNPRKMSAIILLPPS